MLNELKQLFYDRHSLGYMNPVYKDIFCSENNITEREFRRLVSVLRKEGMAVVSNSKDCGYWLTSKEFIKKSEIEKEQAIIMVAETYKRIKNLRAMIKPVEALLSPEDLQIKLFDTKGHRMTY